MLPTGSEQKTALGFQKIGKIGNLRLQKSAQNRPHFSPNSTQFLTSSTFFIAFLCDIFFFKVQNCQTFFQNWAILVLLKGWEIKKFNFWQKFWSHFCITNIVKHYKIEENFLIIMSKIGQNGPIWTKIRPKIGKLAVCRFIGWVGNTASMSDLNKRILVISRKSVC